MSGGKWMRRSDDDFTLHVMALRMQYPAATVGRMLGLKSERIRTICNRVMIDDIRASVKDGIETPDEVLTGYWSTCL